MSYSIKYIAAVTGGEFLQYRQDAVIEHLLPDSRKLIFPATSLFFALKGPRRDGHSFIADLYERGVRNFIVSTRIDTAPYPEANFLWVNDSVQAMQKTAAKHRLQFQVPVIGITGSNGKTIVKEWLNQLLLDRFNIVRSPKSYNSQIGVPLSVWQMNAQHGLGIFEAGISKPGEMEKLEKIIQPTIGIFTNIGEAHGEGFRDHRHKALEKAMLFKGCEKIVYSRDATMPYIDMDGKDHTLFRKDVEYFSWSRQSPATLRIIQEVRKGDDTEITATFQGGDTSIIIPFTDIASIDNAITCWCVLLLFGIPGTVIQASMRQLHAVSMRLELKKGAGNCSIINDSYSADISSLKIAMDFLAQQQQHSRKTVILSDFLEGGMQEQDTYKAIAGSLQQYQVHRFIGVGAVIGRHAQTIGSVVKDASFFPSTDELRKALPQLHFRDEVILLKGARVFEFERIVQLLEEKLHGTVLEIDLNALAANVKAYQQLLNAGTSLMAMVKAFAYGSGSYEIANTLQFHKVDYLGVAYSDEGVELRKAGITIPVMVMNADSSSFDSLVQYGLEPVIYDNHMLDQLENYLNAEGLSRFPVHIEIETGMNRLGFALPEVEQLAGRLVSSTFIVKSVFSHLAASEEPRHDDFSEHQVRLYLQACTLLQQRLPYEFIKHIANTAAIHRKPQWQFDMVRLGIGMYGIDSSGSDGLSLQEVSTLKSTIAQVKQVREGETISYGRKGIAEQDKVIATVRVGYADGYPRSLSNGRGKIWVNGRLAPVIGVICMDMTMIDITGIPDVKEGDEVIIFGKELPVKQVAEWAGTIPYEMLTGISYRVKRVYYQD
ncbi:MAG TPA: bifunctional UDP-N-acetylmuramoyl-tripeptide:D-alanyl-D-alanine ligase/alanine racemase [Chitinophagaceae bacterium]|nr:bifunctional UDP-N-acetylmuramoyl-tripeptide:D-alanyl-D-alanine ligase/alanine racemase [Chitinophagaceae bacterium]